MSDNTIHQVINVSEEKSIQSQKNKIILNGASSEDEDEATIDI